MQSNVDICTKESSLIIKRGLYNLREKEREFALSSVKYILTDVNNLRKSYICLGFHLFEMKRMKYYEDFGYVTLEEFCDANIGMDKSSVSRCISVFERFSAVNDSMSRTHLMYIDDRWKNYSYSQLCEMVSMSDDLLLKVRPEMSVRQLRELKKEKSSVATSQQEKKSCFLCASDLVACKGIVKMNKIMSAERLAEINFDVYDSSGRNILNFCGDMLFSGEINADMKSFVVRLDDSNLLKLTEAFSDKTKEG